MNTIVAHFSEELYVDMDEKEVDEHLILVPGEAKSSIIHPSFWTDWAEPILGAQGTALYLHLRHWVKLYGKCMTTAGDLGVAIGIWGHVTQRWLDRLEEYKFVRRTPTVFHSPATGRPRRGSVLVMVAMEIPKLPKRLQATPTVKKKQSLRAKHR